MPFTKRQERFLHAKNIPHKHDTPLKKEDVEEKERPEFEHLLSRKRGL